MSRRTKILLVALELTGAARLPRALQEAGFEVGVACRPQAHLAHTKFRDHLFRLSEKNHGGGILSALRTITAAWPPDLILPNDDRSALFLARAHELLTAQGTDPDLVSLLVHSLGRPSSVSAAVSKRQTLAAAQKLGLRVPANGPVSSREEVRDFARRHGFPVVLKHSFSSAGQGVFICQDEAEVEKTLGELKLQRALAFRFMLWREKVRGRVMDEHWLPADESLIATQYIAGRSAMSLAAAVEGRMLGVLTAEAIMTHPGSTGPSSVVRFIHHEEMRHATGQLLKHWGLTGLIGFDFILDAAGQAWLLECNPRPTPIAHLGARVGEDLCAALHAGLAGLPVKPPASASRDLVVAHFPKEMWRDSRSPYLAPEFHDVPLDDPELMRSQQSEPPHKCREIIK